MRLPIDIAKMNGEFYCETITPVMVYGTSDPKKNDAGETQYRFNCRYLEADSPAENIQVKVFLPKEITLKPFQQVYFSGLVANPYEMNGRRGLSYTADKIVNPPQAK